MSQALSTSLRPCSLSVAAALLAWAALAAPARAQSVGWLGPSYEGVESVPTGSKPESKLWWNDGLWWGCLWSEDAQAFTIHALRVGSQTWQDTLVAVDTRPKSRADCLWDGAKLYIATHQYTDGVGAPGYPLELYRYSYDPRLHRYSLDVGFPTLIGDAKTETLVIDEDGEGRLWAVWMAGLRVWTAHTLGDDLRWSTPAVHPANTSDLDEDDIASIVAFAGHVGVMWSDQVHDRFSFTTHADAAPESTWSALQTVLSGPNVAQDHLSLRSHPDGRVFAALGTGTGEVHLAVRSTGGVWSDHLVAPNSAGWGRPILLIDEQAGQVHVFGTKPETGGAIHAKTSALDAPVFDGGAGIPVIRDANALAIQDPTSTKQVLRGQTGLVVLASHEGLEHYVHQHDRLGGRHPFPPVARFFADPHGEYAPLDVQFHDASRGQPTSWSWTFGDGTTSSLRQPLHTYQQPGLYTVSLQVSNALGNDVETLTGLVHALDVPTSLVLRPIGDGHAYEGAPDSNRAGTENLRIRGGREEDYRAFLKFFVPPMPAEILDARLQLACLIGSQDGGTLYHVDDDWEEPTLTWNTMPALEGPSLGNFGEVDPDTNVSMIVDEAVDASGTVSFGMESSNFHSAHYSSREGPTPPELRLELLPLPSSVSRAALESNRREGMAPLTVQFFDASNGRVAEWLWDFGDGTTSDVQNPSHVYRLPGRYAVTLTVIGADGSAAASAPRLVRVEPRSPARR